MSIFTIKESTTAPKWPDRTLIEFMNYDLDKRPVILGRPDCLEIDVSHIGAYVRNIKKNEDGTIDIEIDTLNTVTGHELEAALNEAVDEFRYNFYGSANVDTEKYTNNKDYSFFRIKDDGSARIVGVFIKKT